VISIRINGERRQYSEGIEHWIVDQVDRRRSNNGIVCVEINVNFSLLNMVLRTPGCVTAPGASRQPTTAERRIFELWEILGLNDPRCGGRQVVAFLQQLRRNT